MFVSILKLDNVVEELWKYDEICRIIRIQNLPIEHVGAFEIVVSSIGVDNADLVKRSPMCSKQISLRFHEKHAMVIYPLGFVTFRSLSSNLILMHTITNTSS